MVRFSLSCVTENVHVRLRNSLVESFVSCAGLLSEALPPHYISTTLSWIRIEDIGLKIFIHISIQFYNISMMGFRKKTTYTNLFPFEENDAHFGVIIIW